MADDLVNDAERTAFTICKLYSGTYIWRKYTGCQRQNLLDKAGGEKKGQDDFFFFGVGEWKVWLGGGWRGVKLFSW